MASFGKNNFDFVIIGLVRFIYFDFSATQPDFAHNSCCSDHKVVILLMHPPKAKQNQLCFTIRNLPIILFLILEGLRVSLRISKINLG